MDNEEKEDGLGKDRSSIMLLLLLYVLQGIPLGLAGSIPMILQNRHVTYKDQVRRWMERKVVTEVSTQTNHWLTGLRDVTGNSHEEKQILKKKKKIIPYLILF